MNIPYNSVQNFLSSSAENLDLKHLYLRQIFSILVPNRFTVSKKYHRDSIINRFLPAKYSFKGVFKFNLLSTTYFYLICKQL